MYERDAAPTISKTRRLASRTMALAGIRGFPVLDRESFAVFVDHHDLVGSSCPKNSRCGGKRTILIPGTRESHRDVPLLPGVVVSHFLQAEIGQAFLREQIGDGRLCHFNGVFDVHDVHSARWESRFVARRPFTCAAARAPDGL